MDSQLLVIDDDPHFLDTAKRVLRMGGFRNVILENNPANALAHFEDPDRIALAVIDVDMPQMSGLSVLEKIRSASPGTECIMLTAIREARTIVEAMKKGAYDYLIKPLAGEELVLAVNRALERRRLLKSLEIKRRDAAGPADLHPALGRILTRDAGMKKILLEAQLHAASNAPAIITGESGTGKELLAQAVHSASLRASRHFTAVNMASMSSSLFDAEFFGHTRGAFTGAHAERAGYLETTDRGTLFLDEIGHLPLDLQGKLLRVLQEGEYMALGTSKTRRIDIRFIAATNVDLEKEVRKGTFRADLYYRLKCAWLHLPPLRERKDDIPLLALSFFREFSSHKTDGPGLHPETLDLLMGYDFPGNVRELKMMVQSAVNLARGQEITPAHLPKSLRSAKAVAGLPSPTEQGILPLHQMEREHILKAYAMTEKNKARTARALEIGINTLRRKLQSYGEE